MHTRASFGPGPAGSDITSALAWVDLAVARQIGELSERDDVFHVRTPNNWGYHHGNFLFLPGVPRSGDELSRWSRRFHELFAGDPVEHVCLCWDRGELEPEMRQIALDQGFVPNEGVEMRLSLDRLPEEPAPGQITVRLLDLEREWAPFEALNRAADPSEHNDDSHRLFKDRWRVSWLRLVERGHARWFGAFWEGELVGQCGLVSVGGLGGFESVETHPDWRRRGVCSALMSGVTRACAAEHPLGYVLGAEPHGPAIALYRRLGFRDEELHVSLVRPPDQGSPKVDSP